MNKCVDSWKKYCPDYEIIEWNEDNFDINCNDFVKEAYEAKKWAFVSDVARLWVLFNHGGVYMDTDCELIKPIDDFMESEGFSGFETPEIVPTAIMGCVKSHKFIGDLLSYYDLKRFKVAENQYDTVPNTRIISHEALKHGIRLDNTLQTVADFTFYPTEYFCPKDYGTSKITLTPNTHSIHHFTSSWYDEDKLRMRRVQVFLVKTFGVKLGPNVYKVYREYVNTGFFGMIKRIWGKLWRRK